MRLPHQLWIANLQWGVLVLIWPHTEYCDQAYSPCLIWDVNHTEKLYSLATKMTKKDLQNVIFSLCPTDVSVETIFWNIRGVTKRLASGNRTFSTLQRRANCQRHSNALSIRVVPFWNRLPVEASETASLSLTKHKLESILLAFYFNVLQLTLTIFNINPFVISFTTKYWFT